jgi:hypothetical protein
MRDFRSCGEVRFLGEGSGVSVSAYQLVQVTWCLISFPNRGEGNHETIESQGEPFTYNINFACSLT